MSQVIFHARSLLYMKCSNINLDGKHVRCHQQDNSESWFYNYRGLNSFVLQGLAATGLSL